MLLPCRLDCGLQAPGQLKPWSGTRLTITHATDLLNTENATIHFEHVAATAQYFANSCCSTCGADHFDLSVSVSLSLSLSLCCLSSVLPQIISTYLAVSKGDCRRL